MKVIRNIFYLIICFAALVAGCAEDPKMPDNQIGATAPTVIFVKDTAITATTATVYGKITSKGGSEITEKGFRWHKDGETDKEMSSSAVTEGEGGLFYMTISELSDSTKYQVYAYAKNVVNNSVNDAKSETSSFTTIPGRARVETISEPVLLRANRAIMRGEITDKGDGAILEKGFKYRKATDEAYTDSIPAESDETGDIFEVEITELDSVTEYRVMAYVKNNFGISYGEEVKITTTDGKPVIKKEIEKVEITETSATFSVTITYEGDSPITSSGFIYAKTKEELDGTGSYTISVGNVSDGFTRTLTMEDHDLQTHQPYYITAFAKNSYGEVRTDTIQFILRSNSPTVATREITIPESGSLLFKGRVDDWGYGTYQESGFVYSIDKLTWKRETVEPENLNFEKRINNILPNTTYYVSAYATNSDGFTSYGDTVDITTPDIFSTGFPYNGQYLMEGSTAYVRGYLIGGISTGNDTPSNEFWEFNPNSGWNMLGNIPAQKAYASVVNTGSALLLFGGIGKDKLPTNDLYSYTYSERKWKKWDQNNPPSPRYASASGVAGDMYLIGGIKRENDVEIITDEVHIFQILQSNWMPLTPFPEAQYNGLAFTINNKIYAGLGRTSLEDPQVYSKRFFVSETVSETTIEWKELSPMPGTKALGGTVVGTDIYVVDDQGYIHIFDTVEEIWRTVSRRLPEANRKIHCVYGFTGDKKVYIGLGDSREVISYDPGWDN